jgi:hypothetical protein
LVYFTAIWYILWPLSIHILWLFGVFFPLWYIVLRKIWHLATLLSRRDGRSALTLSARACRRRWREHRFLRERESGDIAADTCFHGRRQGIGESEAEGKRAFLLRNDNLHCFIKQIKYFLLKGNDIGYQPCSLTGRLSTCMQPMFLLSEDQPKNAIYVSSTPKSKCLLLLNS